MFVKPAHGRIVRDPVSKLAISVDGHNVNETEMYWARRLRDGDIVEAKLPAVVPAIPAPARDA
jgi:hypothetical protein